MGNLKVYIIFVYIQNKSFTSVLIWLLKVQEAVSIFLSVNIWIRK